MGIILQVNVDRAREVYLPSLSLSRKVTGFQPLKKKEVNKAPPQFLFPFFNF